jgi:predicted DNA-binding protein
MTISLRLDKQRAKRLEAAAKATGLSKSALVRRCLDEFLGREEQKPTAWELGEHLFGCDSSGHGDLSERAEEIVKERIHARRARPNRR